MLINSILLGNFDHLRHLTKLHLLSTRLFARRISTPLWSTTRFSRRPYTRLLPAQE
jgi:hypothetical protein